VRELEVGTEPGERWFLKIKHYRKINLFLLYNRLAAAAVFVGSSLLCDSL